MNTNASDLAQNSPSSELDLLARHVAKANLIKALTNSAEDAILSLLPDGRVTSWNPAAERLFGLAASNILYKPIDPLLTPVLLELVYNALESLPEMDGIDSMVTIIEHSDGHQVNVAFSMWPIRDDKGVPLGAAITLRDVTRRIKAEENFKLAVMACPSGMIMVDRSGQIVLVNQAAEMMFGYGHDALIGQSIDILVPIDRRGGHQQHRDSYTANPETRSMGQGRELYALRRDGSQFPVEIGLNAISGVDGVMTLAVIVDISDRRRAEEELMAHTEELRRSNADLEQFAYVASHDLREPLRMVANYTELLSERYKGQLDERADTYIGYAVEGARRMQQLVSDLLAYARVGTQARAPIEVDANLVLNRVLAGMQGAIMESNTRIDVITPLPKLLCDEIQLGQVLQNLLSNAIKFRLEGRQPVVSIAAERNGKRWTIKVRDNGIGIEAQYADRIFQMFQRLHDRGEYQGNGIGLAISKRIVERHGGRLEFTSVPGEGSEFYFQMPAGKEGLAT